MHCFRKHANVYYFKLTQVEQLLSKHVTHTDTNTHTHTRTREIPKIPKTSPIKNVIVIVMM